MRALRIIIGLSTLVTGSVCYSYCSYYGGRFEAHVDLMRGRYIIRVFGPQDSEEFKEILAEYGVEMVTVAGCIVSDELVEKTRGYNEVAKAAIENRHGPGILEKLWRRAHSDYLQFENKR